MVKLNELKLKMPKMPPNVSSIWHRQPSDVLSRTRRCVDEAFERLSGGRPGYIFFRDDDVAVPGQQFLQLRELFFRYRIPLNLAIVPAWLTRERWQSINALKQTSADLWCWHQHGWRHKNHEFTGKKQEFGPSRGDAALEDDILKGRRRLERIIGKDFYPVFTPPWNRCDARTLRFLKKHGFVAVSRSQNANRTMLAGLTNFCVNVDLHTRKERSSATGWDNFFEELGAAISSGICGIMLHHNRMNPAAFQFLEVLLEILSVRKDLRVVHFRQLNPEP
jgi:peptidoglycan/xylan/chitin deacetylase (PgdA/CDA1 family)